LADTHSHRQRMRSPNPSPCDAHRMSNPGSGDHPGAHPIEVLNEVKGDKRFVSTTKIHHVASLDSHGPCGCLEIEASPAWGGQFEFSAFCRVVIRKTSVSSARSRYDSAIPVIMCLQSRLSNPSAMVCASSARWCQYASIPDELGHRLLGWHLCHGTAPLRFHL